MTITYKTGLIALTLALMAAALLLPPTAASAEDQVEVGGFALVGTAHLSQGIQPPNPPADGCLGGFAVGGGVGEGLDNVVLANPTVPNAGASFTYNNTLIDGTAQGNLWIDGLELPSGDDININADFDWVRVGFVAVVTFQGNNEEGAAVAALVPVNAEVFPQCPGKKKPGEIDHSWAKKGDGGTEEHVQIAGVGVITG